MAPRQNRLIVHQFDPIIPVPGGIDTCLRGICKYAPPDLTLYIVGVDASEKGTRRLGEWEQHSFGSRVVHFMPVARLNASDQRRRVPHSVRLIAGLLRYRRRLPTNLGFVQAHRADVAAALTIIIPRHKLAYFVHTQDSGMTNAQTDSFWRHAAPVHEWLEARSCRLADNITVFNLSFAETLNKVYPNVLGTSTWWDPDLIQSRENTLSRQILWVGRLERPKDPFLAVDVFSQFAPDLAEGWSMKILGAGTLSDQLAARITELPRDVRDRVSLTGSVGPRVVASEMANSAVLLMTSLPGYEGYPRVMVEALATGLPVVATPGSDTPGLLNDGRAGMTVSRTPAELADAVRQVTNLEPAQVRLAVHSMSAPEVVSRIIRTSSGTGG